MRIADRKCTECEVVVFFQGGERDEGARKESADNAGDHRKQ